MCMISVKLHVVMWSALNAGYVEHAFVDETFKCFRQMQNEYAPPNLVT